MPDVRNFLNPKTIAVVGVSHDSKKIGRIIYSQLLRKKKNVFGINPKIRSLNGNKIYPSLGQLKTPCDLVVYAVPADVVLTELVKAAQLGYKNHLIISAGFEEAGAIGKNRARILKKIIAEYSLNVQGPNCLGNISPVNNLNVSFGGFPNKGNVGIISQSGAIGTAFLDWAKQEGFGISYFISLGNKIALSENEFLPFLAKEDNTKIIGLYLENLADGKKLMEIAKKIKKPIVILKAGQTEEAKIAVTSHTGVLAGSFAAQHAAFSQNNIIEAGNLEEFFNLLKILSFEFNELNFENTVILTNAGGPGVLAVDFFTEHNLHLKSVSDNIKKNLRRILPPSSSLNNPIDLLGDADVNRFKNVISLLSEQLTKILLFIILTPQENTDLIGIIKTIISFRTKVRGILLVSIIGGKRREEPLSLLAQKQIPAFSFFEDAVACLAKIKTYHDNLKNSNRPSPKPITINLSQKVKKLIRRDLGKTNFLSEELVLKIASLYKFPLPHTRLCNSFKEAEIFADRYGFPVVLKVSDPSIIHRNLAGGVFLDIKTKTELAIKYDILKNLAKKIIIQEMIVPEAEIIVGAKKNSDFGHLLMFGSGGIHTEYLKDVSFAVTPLSYLNMLSLIKRTKISSLLSDKKLFWPIFGSLSSFLSDFPEIEEVDLNPIVLRKGKLYCVDFKIKV
ncbi:acetate--CoA ligase family protein [Candidatus Microgenomates bacterium]|nr:acetate--CoA ligase family protein [Candidatus Microgenomates bacterium]